MGTATKTITYRYNSVGNRSGLTDPDGGRFTYAYDSLRRITRLENPQNERTSYAYDAAGNRTLKNEGGARTTYSYDNANQLHTSVDSLGTTTYTFDADGNQRIVQPPTGPRTTTVWDYENRTTLVELATGLRNTMAYEPDGLRIKLEDSTGTKKFLWDDQNYLAETDENDDTQVVYTNETRVYGNLVSQRRDSTTEWYHFDALGSTRQLTLASEAISDTYLYDAWGVPIASMGATINPFRFVGEVGYYLDHDTSSTYVRARRFNPLTATWLSCDPIILATVRHNYSYAHNNPIRWLDPSGLEPLAAVPYFCIVPRGICFGACTCRGPAGIQNELELPALMALFVEVACIDSCICGAARGWHTQPSAATASLQKYLRKYLGPQVQCNCT